MLFDFFVKQITSELPFVPTDEQKECIELLAKFCTNPVQNQAFVLKGYAGTGKTSVVSALVRAMKNMQQGVMLLAPTGRAAKVFAHYSGSEATSIHKKIYRQKSAAEFNFMLDYNKHKNTLFIVDEASMIANNYQDGSVFGSGRLLDDLVQYVYQGENCKMVLLGDTAQLLPVYQDFSPALDRKILQQFNLEVEEFLLTEVVRQAEDSGILYNATKIRNLLDKPIYKTPKINLQFPDIQNITGAELIDCIYQSYREVGEMNTIVVTRSNKRANVFNSGIRNQVLQRESELANGDLLMIVKNNYFWNKKYEQLNFIANGDIAEVVRVRKHNELYGFRFADVTLQLLDYELEIDCKILLDSLSAPTPADNDAIGKKLFSEVELDYLHIGNKRQRYAQMREDEYFNALQVKFSYAVTCHKAQGGQWQHVYIDCGYLTDEQLNKEFLQWLYTAFTRAQNKLFLINFKKEFFEK
ncbi:MAG: AAA family ATPase [Prevotellaceae bacterium]|jgi:exodeoxyribonuclease-5|nr:AAA family ATPase [Prevotellaceae bacterium]